MHRTTTTATLLVTVAFSALTGCMTVQRPPVPGSPTAPVQPPKPRPDGSAEPRIVQAPAREALERVAPSREASPGVPATRRPVAPAPERARQQPARSSPTTPLPRSPGGPRPPHVGLPALPDRIQEGVRDNTDVCALGKKYGGWRQDSPQSVICRRAQGR